MTRYYAIRKPILTIEIVDIKLTLQTKIMLKNYIRFLLIFRELKFKAEANQRGNDINLF